MAVMAREAWTDERLDDLNARVDRLERRMGKGFDEMRAEFASLRQEIAAQSRLMAQMFVTMMVGFLGVIAAIVTQT